MSQHTTDNFQKTVDMQVNVLHDVVALLEAVQDRIYDLEDCLAEPPDKERAHGAGRLAAMACARVQAAIAALTQPL